MKIKAILGLALVGAVAAHAGVVTLDLRGGVTESLISRSYDVTGFDGVKALFTAELPKTGVDASTFTTSGSGGANGIGVTGGIDNSDFDNGESFQLTVQLYTGFVDAGNRGTEVTGDYTITVDGARMRVRTVGSYGLSFLNTVGGVNGSFDVVTPETGAVASSNTTVDYTFAAVAVTSPLIVTSIGNDNGQPYVQQLQTISFDVIPEPATLGLVAVMGGALLFARRRFVI